MAVNMTCRFLVGLNLLTFNRQIGKTSKMIHLCCVVDDTNHNKSSQIQQLFILVLFQQHVST